MIETQPADMLDLSNLNEENDRLTEENLRLTTEVDTQRRETLTAFPSPV